MKGCKISSKLSLINQNKRITYHVLLKCVPVPFRMCRISILNGMMNITCHEQSQIPFNNIKLRAGQTQTLGITEVKLRIIKHNLKLKFALVIRIMTI